jgi:electron transfer flavoprotein beta subunit
MIIIIIDMDSDLRLNEPRYATLPNIMKARKKPIETLNLVSIVTSYTITQLSFIHSSQHAFDSVINRHN